MVKDSETPAGSHLWKVSFLLDLSNHHFAKAYAFRIAAATFGEGCCLEGSRTQRGRSGVPQPDMLDLGPAPATYCVALDKLFHCLSLDLFICKMGVMIFMVCLTELLGASNMVLLGTQQLVSMVTLWRPVGSDLCSNLPRALCVFAQEGQSLFLRLPFSS